MEPILLWAALTFGQVVGPPPVTAPYVQPGTVALWDAVTKDVQGNPEEVATYELALSLATVDLNAAGAPPTLAILPSSDPVAGTAVSSLFQGRVPGNYRLWVRAIDRAGNRSAWSSPVELAWDQVAPRAPLNLRIEIRITIGG